MSRQCMDGTQFLVQGTWINYIYIYFYIAICTFHLKSNCSAVTYVIHIYVVFGYYNYIEDYV